MALPRELTARRGDRHGSKLGDIIRRLVSDSQGEAIAALCAMARLLENHCLSFLDLADHIENGSGGLSEDDKQKIGAAIKQARIEGYAEGVKAAESKQHSTGAFPQHRRFSRVDRGRTLLPAPETSASGDESQVCRRHGVAYGVGA